MAAASRCVKFWLVVLGLGFAFLIFTSALDQNSLALDEGWSLWAVHPASPLDSLRRVSSDVHPPLYFLLLDGWTALAGESVYAARLLSTYFALFGLAATYALAHRLFDNWTGLIAVVWLGSTGFVVYYAREVRAYTLLMALSALSTLAYVRWRGAPRRDTLALYAGLLVALLYTHYVGVWIIVVHGLHALLIPPRRRAWIGAVALVGLLFAPWLPVLLHQIETHPVMEFGRRATTWAETRWLVFLVMNLYWVAQIAPFALGDALPRLRRAAGTAWLLALWIVFPPGVILAVNAWVRPSYQPRYVISVLPAVGIALAYGARRMRWRLLAAVWVTGITIMQLTVYGQLWPEKAPWDALICDTVAARAVNDPLVAMIDAHSVAAYYDRHLGLRQGVVLDLSGQDPDPLDLFAALAAYDSAASVWVIMPPHAPATWHVVGALDGTRGVAAHAGISDFGGVDNLLVYRFDTGDTGNLRFHFGDQIAFEGRIGMQVEAAPGELVCFDLPLRALAVLDNGYSAGLHILNQKRTVIAQVDGGLGARTSGESFVFAPCLTLPPDTPSGVYHLVFVIYDWRTVQNLPVFENGLVWGDMVILGTTTLPGGALDD